MLREETVFGQVSTELVVEQVWKSGVKVFDWENKSDYT